MKINETETHSERNRFVKDHNLPIKVVKSPYFEYYIDLLDPHFGSKKKYKEFKKYITEVKSCGLNFLDYSFKISQNCILSIKNSESYKNFNGPVTQNNVKQKKLYTKENHGKKYISIDIIKANFVALKYQGGIDYDSYDEMIEQLCSTDVPGTSDYFKKSKYFRQVLFGNLNPKSQQKVQKMLISKIQDILTQDVFSFSSDELIIESQGSDLDQIKEKLKDLDFYKDLRIEEFTLNNFYSDYFTREYKDKVEFKQCPSTFFMQIYKKYAGGKINDYDKKFFYEGRLATFDEEI